LACTIDTSSQYQTLICCLYLSSTCIGSTCLSSTAKGSSLD